MSEALAGLLKLYGIGLTLVSPGLVDTRIAETTHRLDPAEAATDSLDPKYRQKLERFEALFEPLGQDRSEERRVGKEWRARGSTYQEREEEAKTRRRSVRS